MPTPISTANSSFYDPNAQLTLGDGSDPSGACTSSSDPPSLPREVTLPPVVVSGDAGARELVKQHYAAHQAPNCSLEGKIAALSCAKAAMAAAGGLLVSSTGIGAAVGVARTFAESISCGKDLRAYYDCKTQ